MEGREDSKDSPMGRLNPSAADFTPSPHTEESKHGLKADAATFEPDVIIESYETHPTTHCRTAPKFEGRYGSLTFLTSEGLTAYDAAEDTWVSYSEWAPKSTSPDTKYARAIMTSATSFVLTGGFNSSALRHSYHLQISIDFGTLTNTVDVFEMNEARYFHSIVLFNGVVFVIAGQNAPNQYLDSVESFEGGQWVRRPQLNRKRAQCTAFGNNSAIWVAGGFCGAAEVVEGIERFDGREWTLVEVRLPMLAAMAAVPVDRFNSMFLLLGGSDGNTCSNRVLVLNTENTTVEEDARKLLKPRAGASVCWIAGTYWVVGGGCSVGEVWSNEGAKETKTMPLSIYAQIEAAAFMKARE